MISNKILGLAKQKIRLNCKPRTVSSSSVRHFYSLIISSHRSSYLYSSISWNLSLEYHTNLWKHCLLFISTETEFTFHIFQQLAILSDLQLSWVECGLCNTDLCTIVLTVGVSFCLIFKQKFFITSDSLLT